MSWQGWLQDIIFVVAVLAAVKPLGGYMERVFAGGPTFFKRLLGWFEALLYRLSGVDPGVEQSWLEYAGSLLAFNLVGMVALYGLQRLQGMLPLNPQHFPAMAADLSLNTAVSFTSNTSWQSYGGETTASNFTQMAGISVQSFLSAATGIVVAVALIRGFARRSVTEIGNFWSDMTRCSLYVLLPICVAATILFVWEGVPETLSAFQAVDTLEGGKQTIAYGPVASQEAIKLLSSDGGGFFNANSAHPFENPTAFTNLIEVGLIFLIGAGLTNMFGRMTGRPREGWALLAAMGILFACGTIAVSRVEAQGNPAMAALGVNQTTNATQAGGNMEGKEVRFGIGGSSLFATVTTDSSSGAVDAMHDSFMPLSGGVLMANMMLDEVIVGGVGSGLFSMLLFAIVAIFIAGLMVGRTPEYLGKKIEADEVKMAMLALLFVPAATLGLTAVACVLAPGIAGISNAGPHGFSEILYAYTSAAATNGSAFAGLDANTPFYNLTLSLAMFVGRYFVIVPVLAVAGSLAAKRIAPTSRGTLPTDGLLFIGFLLGVIVLVGGLTFFPALSLGPIAEHFLMQSGRLY